MKHSKILLGALALATTTIPAQAQFSDKPLRLLELQGWTWNLRAGYNLGGTSPLPLPSEMKSINSYKPGVHLGLELSAQHQFDPHWGVEVAVRLEQKGMEGDVTVENYHTVMVRDGDEIEGNYTGKESTKIEYSMLTVPVLARLKLSSQWSVSAGPYFSYVFQREFSGTAADGYMRKLGTDIVTGEMAPIGEKVLIPADRPATYDFSEDLRTFQWGVQVGTDWQCMQHLSVFAHLNWGLNDTFKSSFKTISFSMYPIYAMVGFGYKL